MPLGLGLHHAPTAIQRQLLYRQFFQHPGGQLQVQRMAGEQRDAEACDHALALGIGRGDFQRLSEVHAFVLKYSSQALRVPEPCSRISKV